MPLAPSADRDCPFCAIAAQYPSAHPPVLNTTTTTASPSDLSGPTAYMLLSTPHLVAFLDHAPISRGHVLVATRQHRVKLADASIEEGAAVGAWLGVLSRAVLRVVGGAQPESAYGPGHEFGDWNVVQNNGPRAAQVVPHVHFHIIPRTSDVPDVRSRSWTIFGRGQREELDDDEAVVLQAEMQAALRQELRDLERREGKEVLDRLLGMGTEKLKL